MLIAVSHEHLYFVKQSLSIRYWIRAYIEITSARRQFHLLYPWRVLVTSHKNSQQHFAGCGGGQIWSKKITTIIHFFFFFFFFFQGSSSNHCLGALVLGAGVELSFDCLIVKYRQAVQSMRRSMDWTLVNNMVDGFFYATLTGREGGTPHLYKQKRKCPRRKRLSRTQALLGRVTRYEAPCICTRWTGERCVKQVSRLHGTVC